MVIVLCIDTFNSQTNGTAISAKQLAESLATKGHSIRVITHGHPGKSGIDAKTGFEMYYTPELFIPIATKLAHRQHTLFAKPVRSILEKAIKGADIVHIFEPFWLGGSAQQIANEFEVPVLAAFHVQPENITYNIGLGCMPCSGFVYFVLNKLFYCRFKDIHCPSEFIATQLKKHGYKAHLHVISNGVHPDFCPSENNTKAAKPPYRVLMVGRLSPEKRQDVLVEAVKRSKYAQDIQLYFAGRGPWEKKLRNMGKRLPRQPVFGYYNKKDLIKLMRQSNLYVHASDVEIEGISCIEAIACGLVPVISDSERSATGQFALESTNLFKAGDVRSLAARMDFWLDNDEYMQTTRKRYLQYVKKFSLERSIEKMEQLYTNISKRSALSVDTHAVNG